MGVPEGRRRRPAQRGPRQPRPPASLRSGHSSQRGPCERPLRGPEQELGAEELRHPGPGGRGGERGLWARARTATFMTGCAKYRALQSQKPVCIAAEMKLLCPAASSVSSVVFRGREQKHTWSRHPTSWCRTRLTPQTQGWQPGGSQGTSVLPSLQCPGDQGTECLDRAPGSQCQGGPPESALRELRPLGHPLPRWLHWPTGTLCIGSRVPG